VADITREELKDLVWISAHNYGELTDETQRAIDTFDRSTYLRLLERRLMDRALADSTGAVGGGTASVAYLQKALDHLDYILSKNTP
jgi:hypothetical protein